ncbi:NAD(FAD)-dependent dehydrogenase [Catenovulum agarivorans DS-2]|uniref:NAD(FAD)-dependent dehydrogenase n=1 Tax=Catenovulum agarivorans DS-2 TaxID=1328313 RepID=W7QJU6_9ALTE|nr:FAD-dependent oxidoreductase [Catenovulum agarivorans]EWH12161.1 NAD(FAD)-dependent dehydrogenase [Catenovulum agarivorans DS-2]
MSEPIIVIGTGPVGLRFVAELRKHQPSVEIKLFGNEPWTPYNRVKLSSLLAKDANWDELKSIEWQKITQDKNVRTYLNCPIDLIDPANQTVLDANGEQHSYSELIMAVGSRPYIPNISGRQLSGVYSFRDMNDVQALLARTVRARHVCVLGGGLLGLETAKALRKFHTQITVVQRAGHLMNNQLDDVAGLMLQQSVEQMNINVECGEGVIELLGEQRVEAIKLQDGRIIACDTVVFAAGIVPNKELAFKSGIHVGRAIKVDHHLRTNQKHIYAIGECAEYQNTTYGLVAPGFEQAAVLAAFLSGQAAAYLGSTTATELKVVGEQVFSIGEVEKPRRPRADEWVFQQGNLYRKVIIESGKIIGAQAIGAWSEARRVQEHVVAGRSIWPWHLWKFRQSGELFSDADSGVLDWPNEALVCQCMAVPKSTIVNCVNARTSCTQAQVISETGAGTVCGSCKPLIAELCGSQTTQASEYWQALLNTSVVSLILSFLLLLMPAIAVADSVQTFSFEVLWTDPLYKQISGFTLLALSILLAIVSLRKRVKQFTWLSFPTWRVVHSSLAIVALFALLLHSGLSFGVNLNQALMISFVATAILGIVLASVISLEHKLSISQAKMLRKASLWGHILAVWPLPVLLSFHIVSVYYF